jgi:hypothetical protein
MPCWSAASLPGVCVAAREHACTEPSSPIKELIKQATGQALSANALLRYLHSKYMGEVP